MKEKLVDGSVENFRWMLTKEKKENKDLMDIVERNIFEE